MSKNVIEIPATEIVERATEIARVGSTNDDSRVWGAMNDVYVREIPLKEDWQFFMGSSALTCIPAYTTGVASVNTGATTVTFAGGAVITAAMTARKIKFSTNPNLYDFTYSNSTGGTLNTGLSEDQNVSSDSFVIFQPVYPLAQTFDRFVKNGGLQIWRGGRPVQVPEDPIQRYYSEYDSTPGVPRKCRVVASDTAGNPQVEIEPPTDKAYLLPYDYFQSPLPLRETTGGTCTVNAGSSSVTFHASAHVSEAGSGWFFRVDAFGVGAQSEWTRVLAVSAANSTATLATAFGLSGATSASYTLCMAPQMPILLHKGLLEGTVVRLMTDQNDPNYAVIGSQYTATLTDAKRRFKSRVYQQQVETALEDPLFRR